MTNRECNGRPFKLLLIGPRIINDDVIGGTKVSFETIVEYFEESSHWDVTTVSTSRRGGSGRILQSLRNSLSALKVLASIVQYSNRADIVLLNISPSALLRIGPAVGNLCGRLGIPLVLRVFGGDLDKFVESASPPVKRRFENLIQNVRGCFLQTTHLVNYFSPVCSVHWLPTSRRAPSHGSARKRCRRLLFVGQLRPEKGIPEILALSSNLPPDVTISIYGAKMPGTNTSALKETGQLSWYGEVSPSQIKEAMLAHDIFLFPTYYEGEGYPGAVIEAMQSGMPVITTRWRSLPDLVEDRVNGLLVEPQSLDALKSAVSELYNDEELVQKLSSNALDIGLRFDSNKVNRKFEERLLEILH